MCVQITSTQGDTELLGGGIGLAVADHFAGPYRRISGTKKALFAAEDGWVRPTI
eukprot:COSAG02_NODE_50065_length_323_cov_0.486607_1_plen_53_part_01